VLIGVEISWYGNGCFRLRSQLGTVITDPYPTTPTQRLPKLNASVVAVTDSKHCDFSAVTRDDHSLLVVGPGEYEIGGIFIIGIPLQSNGQDPVTAYVFELEGLAVCHLGLPWQAPSAAQIESLGNIDVLLLPVGAPGRIGVQAVSDLASEIEPKVLIPMYYSQPDAPDDRYFTLDRLAHEMGAKLPESDTTLNTRRKGGLGQNALVVLECRAQLRRESVSKE
jgi:L-ascorbate metabolism protein UlaG (beta-lactamase superfamily)